MSPVASSSPRLLLLVSVVKPLFQAACLRQAAAAVRLLIQAVPEPGPTPPFRPLSEAAPLPSWPARGCAASCQTWPCGSAWPPRRRIRRLTRCSSSTECKCQSSLLTHEQDLLSLRRGLGRLVLVPAIHDVAQCLRRLNARLARHGDSISARSESVNSDG